MTGHAGFNVVIAYENVEAGTRARETAERITSELNADLDVNSEIWNFELLRHPHLRAQAAADACVADMVLISVSSQGDLPAHVRAWVDEWVYDRQGGAAALVLLLNGQAARGVADRVPVANYLRSVAKRGRMAFFCNTDYQPPIAPKAPARAPAPSRQFTAAAA